VLACSVRLRTKTDVANSPSQFCTLLHVIASYCITTALFVGFIRSSKGIPSKMNIRTQTKGVTQGNTMAAAKLTDGLWKLQRHLRITAVALQDTESASFHAVSESFPVIPKLQVCTAHSLSINCTVHDCLRYDCVGVCWVQHLMKCSLTGRLCCL